MNVVTNISGVHRFPILTLLGAAIPFWYCCLELVQIFQAEDSGHHKTPSCSPITLWGSPGHPTSDFWPQIWVPVTSSGSLIHWTQNSAKQSYRFIVKDKDQDWLYKATGKVRAAGVPNRGPVSPALGAVRECHFPGIFMCLSTRSSSHLPCLGFYRDFTTLG
jgi:hypothetical protein